MSFDIILHLAWLKKELCMHPRWAKTHNVNLSVVCLSCSKYKKYMNIPRSPFQSWDNKTILRKNSQ